MDFEAKGYIVSDNEQDFYDWWGVTAFSPSRLQQALDELPDGDELTININSPGGSMFAGFEMYSKLRASGTRCVAVVQSLAASAASTLAVGCDEVRISPVGQIMIHRSASWQEGNEGDMRAMAKNLASFDESILNAYQLKCGNKAERSKLKSLLNAETWLTAQQAVELGLADSILYDEGGVLDTASVVNLAGDFRKLVTNSAMPPNIEQARAEYEEYLKGIKDGTEPPQEAEKANNEKIIAARRYIAQNRF